MKISIVVPVYNAEKYLEECITSVLNQTNSNWELVLVDDGSTDKSAEICDLFAEKYPDKILAFHKQNEGQFLTRQYGIEKCTGDYIGFFDADDLLDNGYVERISTFIKENKGSDVICFNFAEFDSCNLKEINLLGNAYFETKDELKKLYLQIINGKLTGAMWSKVFKSALIKSTEINSEIVSQKKYGEDAFQSFAILLKAEKISFLADVLYHYRSNPEGYSQGFEKRDFEYFNTKYVSELLEEFLLKKYSADKDMLKQLYAKNFNETVYYILKFYRSAKTKGRKKQIVQYDWSSYLLEKTPDYIENNEYVRKSYKKVWKAFINKAYMEIYLREKFKKYIGW